VVLILAEFERAGKIIINNLVIFAAWVKKMG
jgi:hypothetical protein